MNEKNNRRNEWQANEKCPVRERKTHQNVQIRNNWRAMYYENHLTAIFRHFYSVNNNK